MSSRGKRKPTLRTINRADLTDEESTALFNAFQGDEQPIATAILGAEMVEHELDRLIHQKLRLTDRKLWMSMVDDIGPLSTLHRKIVLGTALRIFDERERHDLVIVKNIRNVFAHNRKLVTFGHDLIYEELMSAKLLKKKFKRQASGHDKPSDGQWLYAILCLRLMLHLFRRLNRRRFRSSRKKHLGPIVQALLRAQSDQPSHSADPNPQAPLGLLSGLSAAAPPSMREEKKK